MGKTVYKYAIPVEDKFNISLPKGAEILCVQTQNDQPCIWAKVDPEAEEELRYFRVAGTGHPLSETIHKLEYIGTFKMRMDALVFHLFESKYL